MPGYLPESICKSKANCTRCRNRVEGNGFRDILNRHSFGELGVDFECPKGYPWNAKVNQDTVAPTPRPQIAVPAQISELAKQRFEICKACEHAREAGFKCDLYKGCCFGAKRTDPKNRCPADPPKWETVPK